MLSTKIFFQILFVWQENDLLFSSEFEKNPIKNNNNNNNNNNNKKKKKK